MSDCIAFDKVCFSYPQAATPALHDVSFAVGRGETCALVGHNGSGKSTALRLLVGLDTPSAGVVRFDGEAVDRSSLADPTFAKRLRQRVGLVFQDPDTQLFCPTVRDEVAFGPRQMGLPESEVQERANDCLGLFGLQSLAERAPWRLSGGEKRRCAIACVVSLAPEVLCLDEPTNGLDQKSYAQVVSFLQTFAAAGKTVLVATHEEDFVRSLRARKILLGS